jgi:predicted anti-sigma-YlaC factor YlaD
MSCKEQQIRIARLFDGEDDARNVSGTFSHLAQCSACREYWHEMKELGDILQMAARTTQGEEDRQLNGPRPPIRIQRTQQRRNGVSRAIVGLSLATVALAAAVFFTIRQPEPEKIVLCRLPVVVVTSGTSTNPSIR